MQKIDYLCRRWTSYEGVGSLMKSIFIRYLSTRSFIPRPFVKSFVKVPVLGDQLQKNHVLKFFDIVGSFCQSVI